MLSTTCYPADCDVIQHFCCLNHVKFRLGKRVPIAIFRKAEGDANEERFAWLCDDEWELPIQIRALDEWLNNQKELPPGLYVADIGFSPRVDATGGGEKMSLKMIENLYRYGMEVHFSEYDLTEEVGEDET